MCIASMRYVVNESGNQMNLEDYRRLLAEVKEPDAIRAYDAAKASGETHKRSLNSIVGPHELCPRNFQ